MKYHEYLCADYWLDYKSDYQYSCPDYRFERMMSEVDGLKEKIDKLEAENKKLKEFALKTTYKNPSGRHCGYYESQDLIEICDIEDILKGDG